MNSPAACVPFAPTPAAANQQLAGLRIQQSRDHSEVLRGFTSRIPSPLRTSLRTSLPSVRISTAKLHLFGRYSFSRFVRGQAGVFGVVGGGPTPSNLSSGGFSNNRNQSIAFGFDYNVSPTWLTDFRFGFYRYKVIVTPGGVGTSPARDAGISFDAQWKFPHLQGHGTATLAGWIDGDSARGRMKVEGLIDGRWTAARRAPG